MAMLPPPEYLMLPPEFLPRNRNVHFGGYIFICSNATMPVCLNRMVFGLVDRYRDSVRAIIPGLPIFLFNYDTGDLHGIFEAVDFGGVNIDPAAWPNPNNPGTSRFPAQVLVRWRKQCPVLHEGLFGPFVEYFMPDRFRCELTVEEAITILDIFEDFYLYYN